MEGEGCALDVGGAEGQTVVVEADFAEGDDRVCAAWGGGGGEGESAEGGEESGCGVVGGGRCGRGEGEGGAWVDADGVVDEAGLRTRVS